MRSMDANKAEGERQAPNRKMQGSKALPSSGCRGRTMNELMSACKKERAWAGPPEERGEFNDVGHRRGSSTCFTTKTAHITLLLLI